MKRNETALRKLETAIFGGGCFWCSDAAFSRVKGVNSVESGYSGGNYPEPNYEQVCTGKTGHAEVVKIEFDPSVVSYSDLLHIFFTIHDPTTLNRQGNDIGPQYRSIIFYLNEDERRIAEKIIGELDEKKLYGNPILTELVPFVRFYPAEDYHQKYFEKNPDKAYCQVVIAPKLAKVREKYSRFLN